jgi:hypothetical protein
LTNPYWSIQGTDSEKTQARTTPFEKLDIRRQESFLREFFMTVGSDFDDVLKEINTDAGNCGFTTYIPPKIKTK